MTRYRYYDTERYKVLVYFQVEKQKEQRESCKSAISGRHWLILI